jgi:hypothetical protein
MIEVRLEHPVIPPEDQNKIAARSLQFSCEGCRATKGNRNGEEVT